MEEWLQCKECRVLLQNGPALATHFLVKHDINILQLEAPAVEFATTKVNLASSSFYWEKIFIPRVSVNVTSLASKDPRILEQLGAIIKIEDDVLSRMKIDHEHEVDEDEESRLLAEMEEELLLAEMEALEGLEDDEDIGDEEDEEDQDVDLDDDEDYSSQQSSEEEDQNETEPKAAFFDRPYKRNDHALAAEHEDKSWPNTVPKDFICCKCHDAFDSRDELEKHKKSHVGERLFPCTECDEAFTCTTNLRYHQLKHSDEWEWLKKHPKDLRVRRREIRLAVTRERRKIYRPRDMKQCPHCPRKFPFSTNLRRHLLRHTQQRPHLCKTCGCSYFDEYHLRKHLERNKCEKVLTDSAARTWQCDICLQRLRTEKGLKSHRRSQHGITVQRPKKMLNCLICGYEASNSHCLIKHQQCHSEEKNWECETKCGAKFGLKINMMNHMRRHCALAEALGIAAKLRQEKATRRANCVTARKNNIPPSADAKFACEQCGDKFPELNRLHVHQKSHGDAVKCEVCSAGFRHSMGLALHKKRVHPNHKDAQWKFKCEVCKVPFEKRYRLKVHMSDVHQIQLTKKSFKPNTNPQKRSMITRTQVAASSINEDSEVTVKTETPESDELQNIISVLGEDDHINNRNAAAEAPQFSEWSVNHHDQNLIHDEDNFEGGHVIILENNKNESAVYDDEVLEESSSQVMGEWTKFEFLDNLS